MENEIEFAHVKVTSKKNEVELSNKVEIKTEIKLETEEELKTKVEPSSNTNDQIEFIPKTVFENTIQELLNPDTQAMDTPANLPPPPRPRLIVKLNLPSMKQTQQPSANPVNAQPALNSATKLLITSANLAQYLPKAGLLVSTPQGCRYGTNFMASNVPFRS
jgi:hypothetical protein